MTAMVLGWCLGTLSHPPFLLGSESSNLLFFFFFASGLKFRGLSRVISTGEQDRFASPTWIVWL